MKFEREKDIAAFKGKNLREKWVLRNKAEDRDPWILRLKFLRIFLIFMPLFAISIQLADHYFHHHFLLAYSAIILLLILPLDTLFYGFFITPRIRRALDSGAPLAA